MSTLLVLALKDLRLLWRDKAGFFFVFGFPLLVALFFGSIFGGSGEGGADAMKVAVVDEDNSEKSQEYVRLLSSVEILQVQTMDRAQGDAKVRKGDLVAVVTLKKGFGSSGGPIFSQQPVMDVLVDPSRRAEKEYLRGILIQKAFEQLQSSFADPAKTTRMLDDADAGVDTASGMPPEQKSILKNYFAQTRQFIQQYDAAAGPSESLFKEPKITFRSVETEPRQQPHSSFEITFPQAVMWGLIAVAASFAISLVQERTRGTYLRLQISPISRAAILGGKSLGCFVGCFAISVILMAIGALFFHVRIASPLLLLLAIVCTALCFAGLMMFISVLGRTEQAVGGASWAVLLLLAMAGGGMVPLMFLPGWFQLVSRISPVRWGIVALEGAIWRRFSLAEMLAPCAVLLASGIALYAIGLTVFRRCQWR